MMNIQSDDDDDNASVYAPSESASSMIDGYDKKSDKEVELAKQETRTVKRLRCAMFGLLILSMIGVAVGVYLYTYNGEKEDFEKQFEEDGHKVLQAIGTSVDQSLGGMDKLVMNMVSFARHNNQKYPYVIIPDFSIKAEKALTETKSLAIVSYNYVTTEQRQTWENYTAQYGREWVQEGINVQKQYKKYSDYPLEDFDIIDNIFGLDGQPRPDASGPYLPRWHSHPLHALNEPYNWDLLSWPVTSPMHNSINTHKVLLTYAYIIAGENDDNATKMANEGAAEYLGGFLTTDEDPMEPALDIYYPVVDDVLNAIHVRNETYDPDQHKFYGITTAMIYIRNWFKNILPEGSNGIVVVVDNPCNPSFTYQINGPRVKYLGAGDWHESKYNHLEKSSLLVDLGDFSTLGSAYTGIPIDREYCPYFLRVYPSSTMEDSFTSNDPILVAVVSILVFLVTSMAFLLYDWWVEHRQKLVMSSAVRSEAIVSSLFPSNIRDRLYDTEEKHDKNAKRIDAFKRFAGGNADANREPGQDSLPIADLFQETTVFFADIKGFTAWSSTRQPPQVFILLETLYGRFDEIAHKRGVFKIETIGDSYVAVTGLPTPRKNHAVVMARFAADCRDAMNTLTRELELTLGPGTCDLALRLGIHSGAVTAGVLRGEKSRFQLFGDTVNTASRMESTGMANRIQASAKTAELLRAAGKGEWLTPRDDLVDVKGKGAMQTYWVNPTGAAVTVQSGENSDDIEEASETDGLKWNNASGSDHSKTDRLVGWNVEMFKELLLNLGAPHPSDWQLDYAHCHNKPDGVSSRDEVVESIPLVPFSEVQLGVEETARDLPPNVISQLISLISTIAYSYQAGNPFHNLEHASHVAMSTKKLLQRITSTRKTWSSHEGYVRTFGIAADPLLQIALVFAALVHDADHPGVSNAQLIKEKAPVAARYENKSVAEQNSVDIAWELFLDPAYSDLHAWMFRSQNDLARFRQHLVNAVMATDIFDPELKAMRDKRWDMAFSDLAQSNDPDSLSRKATIVLEHVIQASDVSHCMQHWVIYQRWNESLFREMYVAYKQGRADRNPASGWYEGELWFFEKYIIPLAKRLNECEVFGAAAHEFLDNAYENRLEWEKNGREIVATLEESCKKLGCNSTDGRDDVDASLGYTDDHVEGDSMLSFPAGMARVHLMQNSI